MKKKIHPSQSMSQLINEGDIEELTQQLNSLSSFELADLIASRTPSQQSLLFGVLKPSLAQQTFEFLPLYIQKNLLQSLPTMQAVSLLQTISADDRTSFLQELPRQVVDELVKLLPHEQRMLTLTLLGYPEGSVGRLMTPDYIAVKKDWNVEEVLHQIKNYGDNCESLDVIYVVKEDSKLLGDIKLRDLLFISPKTKIENILHEHYTALSVYDRDYLAINLFKKHKRIAFPVIDEEGILLGIVTIDDILRLSNQEATQDIQKIGGMEALNEPYMQAPFIELIRKRASWLVILFLGELFTATAMGYFENEMTKAVVLALFLPLIISSGGNAGSQASTLVIRALALGEIKLRDCWTIIKKEILMGICLGTILGTLGFFRVTLWSLFSNIYGEHWLLVALTIYFSLIGVVLWGTLMGAVFPLILRSLKVDPATSSAPFVATVVDVTGLIIYFYIAIFVLRGALL